MTFGPFGDFESRGYLRNIAGEKDLERVKHLEHHVFRLNVSKALAALRTGKPLGYKEVLDTHKRLFGDSHPWTGQDRAETAPMLAVGKGGRYDLFAHPQDIQRAVEHGLSAASDPVQMRAKPGEVMGLLAYAHATLDENGRTIMTVHAELSRRAGIQISWQDITKRDYLGALTRELERPGKELDRLLAPHIRCPAATVAQDAARLRTLPGLGPAMDAGATSTHKQTVVGEVLDAVQTPAAKAAVPWAPQPIPMAERVRAFEEQAAKAKQNTEHKQEQAAEAELISPRPSSGPKP